MTQILPNTCGILSARSWCNGLEHGPGTALSDSDPTLAHYVFENKLRKLLIRFLIYAYNGWEKYLTRLWER